MGAFGCANPRVRVAATAVAPAPRAPIRVRAWRRLTPGPLLAFVMVPPVLDGGTLARGRRECQDRSRQELSQYSCRVSRSEEHTSELQSQSNLVCRLLLEKKKKKDDMLHPQWLSSL